MKKEIEEKIVTLIEKLNIPFCGQYVQDFKNRKKYYVSQFANISISGIGPVFYLDEVGKIYTLLQRRFKDNFQWWFPGGYVELPPSSATTKITDKKSGIINFPDFEKIKNATIDEYYKNAIGYGCWQKAKKEINNSKNLKLFFKKHQINWPKEIDYNWQMAWQREVFEETGVDLEKFKKKIILDFKFNSTMMIGAEKDRLINIDGKYCAFLGVLEQQPKTLPDQETEELRWICLDKINFNQNHKNYSAYKKIVNLYTITLIEEALHEIICHFIKENSKVKNQLSNQIISKFNTPQNLQIYIWQKLQQIKNFNINKLTNLKKFLEWQFGELEIAKNLCGKDGKEFFKFSVIFCK